MKIRAYVLREMGLPEPYVKSHPLELTIVDLDPPGPGEVLVRIRATGLCHSDLSVINGSRPRVMPMVLGHEAAGEVVELGQGVTDLHPGDHVVSTFVPSCGHCIPCQEGRPAMCEPGNSANSAGTLLSGEIKLYLEGDQLHHHLGVSGFAEYAVIDRRSLVKVDPDIPLDIVAMFGCAVLTGVGAVVNTAKISAGSSVAIVGLGGVGFSALLGAQLAGARLIIAIDIQPHKLSMASDFGATYVFDSRDSDVIPRIRELTGGGVDFAFETAGSVQAMRVAYAITRRGGTTVTSGLPHPEHQFAFPLVTMTAEERRVMGSYMGSSVPSRDIPRYLELYKRGKLPINKLLSSRISFDELNEGFDRLNQGAVVRQVAVIP